MYIFYFDLIIFAKLPVNLFIFGKILKLTNVVYWGFSWRVVGRKTMKTVENKVK